MFYQIKVQYILELFGHNQTHPDKDCDASVFSMVVFKTFKSCISYDYVRFKYAYKIIFKYAISTHEIWWPYSYNGICVANLINRAYHFATRWAGYLTIDLQN